MSFDVALRVLSVVLAGLALPRWLRVAQREHYIPRRAAWAWALWSSRSPRSFFLGLGMFGLFLLGLVVPVLLVPAALLGVIVPVGLPYRGRTSPLAWTPRVRRLAAVTALLVLLSATLASASLAVAAVVALPFLVDLALTITAPLERRLSAKYLVQARERMQRVQPTVVAITGSYGKTTTKAYLAHLLGQTRSVLASPASFNNEMGLSRAVNEHLVPGTEVFIAEMGTYGPGEIARLCELFPPDVAVLTAIGEMHLERMRDKQGVLAAKSEITEQARVVVVNNDDPLLRTLADRCAARGQQVVRCSTGDAASDVCLAGGTLTVRGTVVAAVTLPAAVHPGNAACAIGAALALGDDIARLAGRLDTLPTVAHRLEPVALPNGSWILDDTYNANPDGAREAVRRAVALGAGQGGRVHVVTPGMVELGAVQGERNETLAREAAEAGIATLVVVGRTNASALKRGAYGTATEVLATPTREQAVALLKTKTHAGDVVLFENDLPDHYP